MILSDRLIIKPFTEADAALFFELTQDEGFRAFQIKDYWQKDIAAAKTWIQNSPHKWAVWEKESGLLIGVGGLTPWIWDEENLIDITYRLRESAWGKGYGWEMAQALVNFGFSQLNLNEITATITPDNVPSKRIAEKLGMKFDKHIILLNVPTDLYRLKKKDYGI